MTCNKDPEQDSNQGACIYVAFERTIKLPAIKPEPVDVKVAIVRVIKLFSNSLPFPQDCIFTCFSWTIHYLNCFSCQGSQGCWRQSQLSLGEGQGTHWTGHQPITVRHVETGGNPHSCVILHYYILILWYLIENCKMQKDFFKQKTKQFIKTVDYISN